MSEASTLQGPLGELKLGAAVLERRAYMAYSLRYTGQVGCKLLLLRSHQAPDPGRQAHAALAHLKLFHAGPGLEPAWPPASDDQPMDLHAGRSREASA